MGIGALAAVAAMFLYDATKPPPQCLTQRDINAAVARAMASATPRPSYGSIVAEVIRPSIVRVQAADAATGQRKASIGAGVVVDDSGLILTSLHVVKDSPDVKVTFADGTDSEARVVASDPETDLAILRPESFPTTCSPRPSAAGLR